MISKNNKSLEALLAILESKGMGASSTDDLSKEKAKLKIIEKIISTTYMDPLNNIDDAVKALSILKDCEIDAIKNDLDETTLEVIRFLKSILKEKIDSDESDTSSIIQSVINSISDDSMKKYLSEIEEIVREITELKTDEIKIKDSSSSDAKLKKQFDKLEKDYEMDIIELPSNCNNSTELSGIRLSKLMKISYEINPDRTVSLKATNLPNDISKKEFSRLLRESGLAINKKTVLKEGNISLTARLIYSDHYITFFPINTLVKFDEANKEKSCKQKFIIVEKITKNGKVKLKIPDFLNNCNFKVKDLIPKGLRKFFKESFVLNDHTNSKIISDKMAVDDEGNIFNVCIPMIR